MAPKKHIGILGGGISALAFALFLPKNKYTVTILEKESTLGGLARSFKRNGFTFDIGPHIVFAKDTNILAWMKNMLGKDGRKLYRNNATYYKGRFVKYPFENGLHMLPKEDTFECLYRFVYNEHRKKKPKNFREWMYYVFGQGIAEKYLIPYNEKIWKTDPANLTLEWVGGRVPDPPREDIIKSALGIETEGYTHQLYFYYPIRNGIQTLIDNMHRRLLARKDLSLKIVLDCEIASIARKNDEWVVTDSRSVAHRFDIIVNTMPMHTLARVAAFLSGSVKQHIARLRYNSLALVFLGLKKVAVKGKFAVYFPHPDTLFHRVSFNDYLSPHLSPPGHSSLSAEITFREGSDIERMSDAALVAHVVRSLDKEGMIKKADLVHSEVLRVKYEYPVYDILYEKHLPKVHAALDRIPNFYYVGRFAQYKYINMNDCIKNAQILAKRLSV